MNNFRAIGDVHTMFGEYLHICDESPYPTIQVGDFGIGFAPNPVPEDKLDQWRFIRGNHDNPWTCQYQKNYIQDGHIENGMMFIGGAESIDKASRTEGVNWWREEELSYSDFSKLIKVYEAVKPKVMITHDAPETLFQTMFKEKNRRIYGNVTVTRTALEEMFQIHQPKLWICGHYHMTYHKVINDTRFIVLDINQYIDFNADTGEIIC